VRHLPGQQRTLRRQRAQRSAHFRVRLIWINEEEHFINPFLVRFFRAAVTS
jgi:hypothetical protein